MMITFADNGKSSYIPAHRDAAFSAHAKGRYEDSTPVFLLSFLATRTFMLLDLTAPISHSKKQLDPHSVWEFPFERGDMLVMPPPWNSTLKHAVPAEPSVTSLRISVVLRCCTARYVNLQEGWYTEKNGDRKYIHNQVDKHDQPKAMCDVVLNCLFVVE